MLGRHQPDGVKIEHDRAHSKQRNRDDQLANSFLGMVNIATARYGLKFVHATPLRASSPPTRRNRHNPDDGLKRRRLFGRYREQRTQRNVEIFFETIVA